MRIAADSSKGAQMAIDIHTEHLWAIDDYMRLRPPRNGKKMHKSTALRHILQGVRGIKLEAIKIGGTWFTSQEAVERWITSLSVIRSTDNVINEVGARRVKNERVERRLEELGF
jgi:hypothetical protein